MSKKSEETKTDDLSQKSIRELRKIGQFIDCSAITLLEKMSVLDDIVGRVACGEDFKPQNLDAEFNKVLKNEQLKNNEEVKQIDKICYADNGGFNGGEKVFAEKEKVKVGFNPNVKRYFNTTVFSANNVEKTAEDDHLYEKGNNLLSLTNSLYEKSNDLMVQEVLGNESKDEKAYQEKIIEFFKDENGNLPENIKKLLNDFAVCDVSETKGKEEKTKFLKNGNNTSNLKTPKNYYSGVKNAGDVSTKTGGDNEREIYNDIKAFSDNFFYKNKNGFFEISDKDFAEFKMSSDDFKKMLNGNYLNEPINEKSFSFLEEDSFYGVKNNDNAFNTLRMTSPRMHFSVSKEVDLITPIAKGSRTLICDHKGVADSFGMRIIKSIKENHPDVKIFSVGGFGLYSSEYSEIEKLSTGFVLGIDDLKNTKRGFEKLKDSFIEVIETEGDAIFYLPSDSFESEVSTSEGLIEKIVDLLQFCGAYNNGASITAIINIESEVLIPKIQDYITNLIVANLQDTKYRINKKKSYTMLKNSFLTDCELNERKKIPKNWDELSDSEKEKFLT